MKQSPFRVIEGGLAATTEPGHRPFAESWMTNSRLMGVLAVGIHWAYEDQKNGLWQFFYFDCEEMGFDRYEEYAGTDPQAREDLELSVIGGLGSAKVPINQKEAVFLVQHYLKFNRRYGIELPGDPSRYLFLQAMDGALDEQEQKDLFRKSCVPITTQTMLANYFIMRCTGKDKQAAEFLTEGEVDTDLFPSLPLGTLYRNAVSLREDGMSCTCESLIFADGYYLTVTELYFDGLRVVSAQVLSKMPLTEVEAHMILGHDEYVSVFRCTAPFESIDRRTTRKLRSAVVNEEHDGMTYLIFHPNNRHVEANPFILFHDMKGLYHFGRNGEILVSCSTEQDARELEWDLLFSHLHEHLQLIQGYQFTDPVVGHYLESGFTSFLDFVEAIQE